MAEDVLVSKGHNEKQVQADVLVWETNDPRFKGRFATFKDDATAKKYTEGWDTKYATGKAHFSTDEGLVSGSLNNSGIEMKVYDGALSLTDNVPNHIGFTQANMILHGMEGLKASIDRSANIDAKNATTYKQSQE